MSVWEALVLARRKRVALEPSPAQWVRRALVYDLTLVTADRRLLKGRHAPTLAN